MGRDRLCEQLEAPPATHTVSKQLQRTQYQSSCNVHSIKAEVISERGHKHRAETDTAVRQTAEADSKAIDRDGKGRDIRGRQQRHSRQAQQTASTLTS